MTLIPQSTLDAWDAHRNRMNAYVIAMRRDRARACIRSLRYYRQEGRTPTGVLSTVQGAIAEYRATVAVLLGRAS